MNLRTLGRAAFLSFTLAGFVAVQAADAQTVASEVLTISRGTSTLVTPPARVARVSIGDPAIADAVVVSPQEVLVNGRALGATTLIVWDVNGNRRLYNIEVTVDAAALNRQFQALFPGQNVRASASGNLVVISGQVTDAGIARRALELARGTGATVVDNLAVPPARQILLQVRFAEVTRSAITEFGSSLGGARDFVLTPGDRDIDPDRVVPGSGIVETLSDGLVRLFFFEDNFTISAVIRALKARGQFRSLAEPNLLAVEGAEASFLAGGEFPYPIPQAGQQNTVTIVFKEFGVRLRFVPRVTNAGNIRLEVAPEVSSLDFSNGLMLSGFRIPSLLTRRAETEIELRPGQTFAIAGLMDNSILRNAGKVPILGDIPILGYLFQSRDIRENRTELLVLVTPRLVDPLDQSPPVPTGEPGTWDWDRRLRDPVRPATAPAAQPVVPTPPR